MEFPDVELPLNQIPRAREILRRYGLRSCMFTPSFFADPLLQAGAMTSLDPKIRKLALANACLSVDATLQLGAPVMVFWSARHVRLDSFTRCQP